MRILFLAVALTYSIQSIAFEAVTTEPDKDSYNLVSHYRIEINATKENVWKHLKALGSWMYDFEMSHVSGTPGEEGEVLRLYPGRDLFTQITAIVPNELLVATNLPATFNDEQLTGIAVITLNETEEHTVVDLTMSRRFTWQGEGDNPMKAVRESQQFTENTKAMWGRFLERLRTLSET